ncbi:MAG: ComEC family competence protein, partial [Paraprevotella sp.]|nr:ComEC family competence protein [Paraprevotella sp.]
SYLFPVHTDSLQERMSYIAESFWKRKLSAAPVVVGRDFRDKRVSAVSGLVSGSGKVSFLILADDRWNGMISKVHANVDYLYVCRGFRGRLSRLSRLFRPGCVVLDASLWKYDSKRYIQECRTLGWNYYDMEVLGALKVALY